MIYHRQLDAEWQSEAEILAERLGVFIIGRSRKQKIVIGQDYITETLQVAGVSYRYQQIESSFTQPNAGVNQKMLAWTQRACCDSKEKDLLELYCGNGNFTMVLASQFRSVLATEVSKISVRSARFNCELNEINNTTIVRMSSEEFTLAMNGVRSFRRLEESPLSDYDFDTVFVDPPRSGLDTNTLNLIKNFDRVIYVSCNPAYIEIKLRGARSLLCC